MRVVRPVSRSGNLLPGEPANTMRREPYADRLSVAACLFCRQTLHPVQLAMVRIFPIVPVAAFLLLVATEDSVAQNLRTQARVFAPVCSPQLNRSCCPRRLSVGNRWSKLRQTKAWIGSRRHCRRVARSSASRRSVTFTNEVWGLEFTFKPLRMVNVDLPQPDGSFERKLLWYLVYNVKNSGQRIRPVEDESGEFTAEPADPQPVRFLPHFVLEGQDRDASGEKIYKAYLDRILPAAVETIRRRETPDRVLLNSAQMASEPIVVSTDAEDNSVWGVAIWEDIDPEMDFLSIFVGGLTNAHVWADTPGEFRPGDPAGKGRRIAAKTLQLNFWRPGDEFLQREEEIRYGVAPGKAALYGVEEGVAYTWTFR